MILTPELEETLLADGYFQLRVIDGKICGLMKFAFTLGLMVNITMDGVGNYSTYEYRFCYPYEKTPECLLALELYKYGEDPVGGWVKQKGSGIDRVNPAIEEEWIKTRK